MGGDAMSKLSYTIRDISRTDHPKLKFEIWPDKTQLVKYGDKWVPLCEYVCDMQCSQPRGQDEHVTADIIFRNIERRIKAGKVANWVKA
jgi:hypothetical protein